MKLFFFLSNFLTKQMIFGRHLDLERYCSIILATFNCYEINFNDIFNYFLSSQFNPLAGVASIIGRVRSCSVKIPESHIEIVKKKIKLKRKKIEKNETITKVLLSAKKPSQELNSIESHLRRLIMRFDFDGLELN